MGKYGAKPVPQREAQGGPAAAKLPEDNPELEKIASWLANVTFRRQLVGGVDQADVWKKIEELNGLYQNALIAERTRCNLLIRQLRLRARERDTDD